MGEVVEFLKDRFHALARKCRAAHRRENRLLARVGLVTRGLVVRVQSLMPVLGAVLKGSKTDVAAVSSWRRIPIPHRRRHLLTHIVASVPALDKDAVCVLLILLLILRCLILIFGSLGAQLRADLVVHVILLVHGALASLNWAWNRI